MRTNLLDLIKKSTNNYAWVMKPRQGKLDEQPNPELALGGYTPPDLNVPKNMMTKKLNKNALGNYVSSFSPDIVQPEEDEATTAKRYRYMQLAKRAQQGGVNA